MTIYRRNLILTLLFSLPFLSNSQDLTGIWRGYFITEMGEQYKLEFQVQQSKSLSVKGVSYSYLDSRFYGKATMTGNFGKKTASFAIQELRTVEVRNLGGGATCLMNYKFSYVKSGREEFLEGTYVGKKEDKIDPKKNGVWGDCGGGTVYLRRVPTSDFYVEPFLRNTPALAKKDTAIRKITPAPANKPSTNTTAAKPKPPVQKPQTAQKPIADTVTTKVKENIAVEKAVEKPKLIIPEVTRSRKNELTETITVTSQDIQIKLYDNGEVDDDTVSVYLNGQLILANKRLSTVPIVYNLKLDENSPEQVLVMVAENMGRIPPNTSLMIVQDGNKRHSVNITSTEQKNAMVRFRYQKAPN
jgi:hypothetical protein